MVISLKHLLAILDCTEDELKDVLANIDYYYYTYSEIKYDQKTGLPKIKNDEVQKRHFDPSRKRLRDLQNRIQHKILSRIELIPNILGGVKGYSNVDNAKIHKGKIYRFQTDLTNFFPSVTKKMVYNSLRAKGFSKKVADILTKLTTINVAHSWKGSCLPQGAPTSPALANIVFEKIDFKILEIIKDEDIAYSRWIDDLTFSSNKEFQDKCNLILKCIGKNGLKVSKQKTTFRKNKSVITGVIAGISTMKVTEEFRNRDESNMKESQIKGRNAYKNQIFNKSKKKE